MTTQAIVQPVVITGRDDSRAAFDSLKRNAQGAQSAVSQLGSSFAALQSGNVTGLLSLPAAFAGMGGAAAALTAIAAPIALIAAAASKVKDGAFAFGEYARETRNAAEQSELGIAPTQAMVALFAEH